MSAFWSPTESQNIESIDRDVLGADTACTASPAWPSWRTEIRCDALNAILRASRVNGTEQRGATSDKGPQEQTNRAQESWINGHIASTSAAVQNRIAVLKAL